MLRRHRRRAALDIDQGRIRIMGLWFDLPNDERKSMKRAFAAGCLTAVPWMVSISAEAASYEVIPTSYDRNVLNSSYTYVATIFDNVDGKVFVCSVTHTEISGKALTYSCRDQSKELRSALAPSADLTTTLQSFNWLGPCPRRGSGRSMQNRANCSSVSRCKDRATSTARPTDASSSTGNPPNRFETVPLAWGPRYRLAERHSKQSGRRSGGNADDDGPLDDHQCKHPTVRARTCQCSRNSGAGPTPSTSIRSLSQSAPASAFPEH